MSIRLAVLQRTNSVVVTFSMCRCDEVLCHLRARSPELPSASESIAWTASHTSYSSSEGPSGSAQFDSQRRSKKRRRTNGRDEVPTSKSSDVKQREALKLLRSWNLSFSGEAAPRVEEVVEIAYNNLLPEYRRAISDRLVDTLDRLESYGLAWERQRAINSRYVPPPTADKMTVKGAAFKPPTSARVKVAAATTVSDDDVDVVAEVKSDATQKKQAKKGKNNKPKGKAPAAKNAQSAPLDEELLARWQAMKSTLTAEAESEQTTHQAAAMQTTYASAARAGASTSNAPPRATQQVAGAQPSFAGACFKCQLPGHRANECPSVKCYNCAKQGHISRSCPSKAAKEEPSCCVCGTRGVSFQQCVKCEESSAGTWKTSIREGKRLKWRGPPAEEFNSECSCARSWCCNEF
ncbi:unnamed protein product [Trichogramma brassicae]|uniref:CCHC-type domain-containing protein n=1 Tax=Trichogramma brassicae TaxID=86971 RepID=A0A6H5J770_9HYME|nr:unnamed protein product [Trichogramma brassicae]